MTGISRTFQSLPFAHQLVVLALVFDPLGAVGGYLLGPTVGLDPLVGAAAGVALASIPTGLFLAIRRP